MDQGGWVLKKLSSLSELCCPSNYDLHKHACNKVDKTIIRYNIIHNMVFQINIVIHKSPRCKCEVVLTVFMSGCLPLIKSDLFGALSMSGSVYPATAHHM